MNILEGLLHALRTKCASLPDKRVGKNIRYSMLDIGTAAFSVFFMQNESFLQHQRMLEAEHGDSNCKTLFGMSEIPTDNHIRHMLDGTPPNHFDNIFAQTVSAMNEANALKPFHRLDEHVLIALDGTEYFNSYEIHCKTCSHRERSNGKIEYFHTLLGAMLVAPGHNKVLPLPPEFIAPQDGHNKQDCESMAARRWLKKYGSTYSAYKPIYLGDDLFSKHPICTAIRAAGGNFILTCKPSSHQTLSEYLQGVDFSEYTETVKKGKKTFVHRYTWICEIPIRDGEDAIKVNYFYFEIFNQKGERTYHNSFVTDLPVHQENVVELAACGRSRWKIENESFNTMKNHGYNLEHNFGHGKETLASVLVVLNFIAFAFHTACEISEEVWKQARTTWGSRRLFFSRLWNIASFLVFATWDEFMRAVIGSPSKRRRPAPSG
jgi:hypothetical protein